MKNKDGKIVWIFKREEFSLKREIGVGKGKKKKVKKEIINFRVEVF